MLSRIFPRQFDNASYRGHWLAVWLFGVVTFMKAAQAIASLVDSRDTLTTGDGIPLDSYSGGSAEVVLALFAVGSLYLLMLPLQSVVVLIRYRAMIPFMYLLLLILNAGSRVLWLMHPIVRSDAHPIGSIVNLAITAMTLIGFVLSLRNRPALPKEA